MKIVLHVAPFDGPMDLEDMTAYVHTIQNDIRRRADQGFPGVWLQRGDGGIWVTNAEIVLDTEAEIQ